MEILREDIISESQRVLDAARMRQAMARQLLGLSPEVDISEVPVVQREELLDTMRRLRDEQTQL